MKYQKNSAGHYVIKGKTYELLVGSRAQVMHGTAYKTTGDLTRNYLIQNKHGRIVSRSKYNTGKNKNKNNLLLNGYTAKKGKFGYVKVGTKSRRRTKHRGGNAQINNTPEQNMPKVENSGNVNSAPTNNTPDNQLIDGVNNSSLANNAGSFTGGRRHRIKGGILLGGKRRKTIKRGGGPLTPSDY
jgi:hypothetical protein